MVRDLLLAVCGMVVTLAAVGLAWAWVACPCGGCGR